MVKRLFIANRGEIVRRIALSARPLGIETVAIVAGEGPPAFLAGVVDHFVKVPRVDAALYSDGQSLLTIAVSAGCDAIHPGFGFLAESAAFAQLVTDAGLTFVGPDAAAISALGNKANARMVAERCQIPCVPGMIVAAGESSGLFAKALKSFVAIHGLPILIKNATSGGGRGMRRIENAAELEDKALLEGHDTVRALAGDGLIIEKYIAHPRHVEVQIIADRQGAVIALGDRECSLQRRFQKVVEEAPARLDPSMRRALHDAAVRLAREAGYASVGTVEFIIDASSSDPCRPAPFYFLEMNTRLQVEHTVTEQVFDVDLVAWQLKIASGEPLAPEMANGRTPRGASIQARLYAEKVDADFMPAPGVVHAFVPYQAPFMRWEIGIDPIDEVSMDFDPMIAKAIATGATRDEAIGHLLFSLEKTVYAGTDSNLSLLIALLQDKEFRNGAVDTHFISKNLARFCKRIDGQRAQRAQQARVLFDDARLFSLGAPLPASGRSEVLELTRRIFSRQHETATAALRPPSLLICDEQTRRSPRLRHIVSRTGRALVDFAGDGKLRELWFVETKVNGDVAERTLSFEGVTLKQEAKERRRYGAASHDERVATKAGAPVPGRVVGISVAKGDQIIKNDIMLTIESMKMEFAVRAPCDLTVGDIVVAPGAMVRANETLVVW